MSIFSFPDDIIEKKYSNCKFSTFEDLKNELEKQVGTFPSGARIVPVVLKRGRVSKKENYFEITIKASTATLAPNMKPRCLREWVVIHRRLITGTIDQMAKEALAIIFATKQMSEILTVLEEQ